MGLDDVDVLLSCAGLQGDAIITVSTACFSWCFGADPGEGQAGDIIPSYIERTWEALRKNAGLNHWRLSVIYQNGPPAFAT
jgi:hypothetical protein